MPTFDELKASGALDVSLHSGAEGYAGVLVTDAMVFPYSGYTDQNEPSIGEGIPLQAYLDNPGLEDDARRAVREKLRARRRRQDAAQMRALRDSGAAEFFTVGPNPSGVEGFFVLDTPFEEAVFRFDGNEQGVFLNPDKIPLKVFLETTYPGTLEPVQTHVKKVLFQLGQNRYSALLDSGATSFVLEGPNSGGMSGVVVADDGVYEFVADHGLDLGEKVPLQRFLDARRTLPADLRACIEAKLASG